MEVEERVDWNREEMEKEITERERSRLKKEEEERIKNARYKEIRGCLRGVSKIFKGGKFRGNK